MSNWYWTNSPSYRLYRNTYFTSVWDTVDFHATKIYFTFLAKLQWICSWLYYLHCVNLYFFCLLSLFKMSSIHYLSKIIFFICLILDLSTLKEYSKDWEAWLLSTWCPCFLALHVGKQCLFVFQLNIRCMLKGKNVLIA